MEPSELLRYATQLLEGLGLRYFVTGSTATIFYGEPRFTEPTPHSPEASSTPPN